MNKAKVVQKAEAGEGLTVAEIKVYQKTVKPEKQVYGKYGTLAKRYLEDKGIDWTIANLPEYLHGVDKAADELYETLYEKILERGAVPQVGGFYGESETANGNAGVYRRRNLK